MKGIRIARDQTGPVAAEPTESGRAAVGGNADLRRRIVCQNGAVLTLAERCLQRVGACHVASVHVDAAGDVHRPEGEHVGRRASALLAHQLVGGKDRPANAPAVEISVHDLSLRGDFKELEIILKDRGRIDGTGVLMRSRNFAVDIARPEPAPVRPAVRVVRKGQVVPLVLAPGQVAEID